MVGRVVIQTAVVVWLRSACSNSVGGGGGADNVGEWLLKLWWWWLWLELVTQAVLVVLVGVWLLKQLSYLNSGDNVCSVIQTLMVFAAMMLLKQRGG